MELLDWLIEHKEALLTIVTTSVTLASLVASLTPTPKDDTFVGKLYKLVDTLALNIGRAKEVNSAEDKK